MEEDGTEKNFPATYRTKETADLFLVLIVHLLRDGGHGAIVTHEKGRAAQPSAAERLQHHFSARVVTTLKLRLKRKSYPSPA